MFSVLVSTPVYMPMVGYYPTWVLDRPDHGSHKQPKVSKCSDCNGNKYIANRLLITQQYEEWYGR